jgi:catechol 2,3-dioxygenase-like lactoylglutathione lyase family enzyme
MIHQIRASLVALAAVGCSPSTIPVEAGESATPVVAATPAVRSLSITVSNLDRSVAFFRGMDFVLDGERDVDGAAFDALTGIHGAHASVARLHLGTEVVELRSFAGNPGRPVPEGAHANDAIFQHMAIVVGDMDAAFARIVGLGARTVSPAPQTIPLTNPAAGGIRAAYFLDPDGHDLEVIWFPRGKGNPRWQGTSGVFLGVDHSAIAVGDTDESGRFYEALGFTVAGRSLNFGPEQEALSGVAGARVRITGLAPKLGPAVEFLSYLAPGPGAPAPADAGVTDLWHWEITVEVGDVDHALGDIVHAGGAGVTNASIDVRELRDGYSRAALAKDRDGHWLRLVQR